MVSLALVVPVMVNFEGFTKLIESVDHPITPFVIPNWNNNIGVSKGWNLGLYKARNHDLALVCNDDIVFEPNTISHMVREFLNSDYDLVTAVNTRDGVGDPAEPDYSCFLVRPRTFVESFGFFDENFTPAYFEDNDMAYRVRIAGGSQIKLLDAKMYHSGSVTQNWGGKSFVTSPMFEKNREYYNNKWGGWPGEEKFITPFNRDDMTVKDW